MGVVVSFDYENWKAIYPEFSAVSQAMATNFFAAATMQHNNTVCGPVNDVTMQTYLLNLVTAFMAARYAQSQGSPSPGSAQDANTPVGRISSASEGSVSVSTENQYPPGSAQYWQQNKYGADYWNATKAYRTMRYIPRPTVVVSGVYPFAPPYPRGY